MDLCSRQNLVFVLCLVYISGYFTTLATGIDCSCQKYNCNTCPSTGSCTRINVALSKTASASSLYNNTQHGASGPACLAVNGNLQTDFVIANKTNPACVHTADGDVTPHWEVDLGGQYAISSITVYGRYESTRNMLKNATVTVDDKPCYSFAPDYHQPVITEIICSQHLTGSKVRFQKAYTDPIFLALCQVQVWVCNDSYYGPNCTNKCGRCSKGSCDPWSGECPQGCSAGYQAPDCKETCSNGSYGDNCTNTCGNCSSGTCHPEDGVCLGGCITGYQPPYCDKTCSNGSYGVNCTNICGNCSSVTCHPEDGVCSGGCITGYQPPYCNETCNEGWYGVSCNTSCGNCSSGSTCDVYSGVCLQGCSKGYQPPYCNETCNNGSHGVNCTNRCGNCSSGTCHPENGLCSGGCITGYQPPYCNKTCNDGFYGAGCREPCGNCTGNTTCDIYDGTCDTGCAVGYKLPLCTDLCIPGTYGPNCSNTCGSCSEGTTCNAFNGECPQDCEPGYLGSHCNESCRDGTYGVGCKETCGNCTGNSPCNVSDGTCQTGCAAGYQPPHCKEETKDTTLSTSTSFAKPVGGSDNKVPLIAGVTVPCVVVLVIIIVVLAVLFVRRRKTNNKQASFELETAMSRQHREEREGLPLTALPSSSNNLGDEEMKTKKEKPSIAVKPTVVQMSKEAKAGVNDVISENIYANVPTEASSKARTNNHLSSNDIIPDLKDESTPTYRNEENTYATFMASRPQVDRVQQTLIDLLASGKLSALFEELPKGLTDIHEVAKLPVNVKKNRYYSILPYDKNRVVLTDDFSEGKATDFINASYIKGFHQERTYIATQGPRENTVVDFWRMVWQEQITQIIMLTSLVENGRDKCYEYWPAQDGTETYGPVTVTCINVQRRASFFIRIFLIKFQDSGENREVEQFNFVAWPDHGVPTTTSLLNFWRFAKSRAPQRPPPPVLVHCTAGVGRTGAYIGLDIAYEHAVSRGDVHVYDIVERMREERCIMVQAAEQFVFLHEAVLEAYTGRDTIIPSDQFDLIFSPPVTAQRENSRIDREFKKVMQMRSLTPAMRVTIAAEEINKSKIRHGSFLPADEHLVYLTTHAPGRNQFINAVYMSTYREYKGSILTQLPLEETLVDFWRLVDGCDVKTIVSLGCYHEHENIKDFCQFWPKDAGMSLTVDSYIVRYEATSHIGSQLVSYTLRLENKKTSSSRQVQLLNYTAWPGELPDNMTDLLDLIDKVDAICLAKNPAPVIIQCHDGVTRSGLFSTLWNVLSRLTSDKEIDVYMAVREVHSVTPQAMTSLKKYRYCFEVAQRRVGDMNIYTNA